MKQLYLRFNRLLLVGLLLSCYNFAYAQERTISGTVTSPVDNTPLPGVNVLIKGTSQGTITDIDGNYTISANDTDVLVFSFVGFSNTEVPVSSITGNNFNLALEEDVQALSEVVVIGYGSQEKRDATGAVASVKAEDFNMGVISSPEQLIQGKTAGVQITQASGEPGAGVNIRIRGTSSVRAGNNPLFVVDGVPLSSAEVSAGGIDAGRGESAARNPLNFMNPNDIASMDILKDASATAIYGSRGANGVVLITTKSGSGKKHQVEYSSSISISQQAKTFDLLDAEQFLDAAEAVGGDRESLDYGNDTDWQDEINRTAISHRHGISYANSHKSGNYYASISYDDQQGVIENSGLERITGRLNLNQSFLNDRLKFALHGTISRVDDESAPITDAAGFEGDLLGASYMLNPTMPANADEQFPGDIANPLAMLRYIDDNTETNRGLVSASLEYEIIDNLSFKLVTGLDEASSSRFTAVSGNLLNYGLATGPNNGLANINEVDNSTKLLEALFSYEKEFDRSKLSAILGYSYQRFDREGASFTGWGFANQSTDQMIDDVDAAASIFQNAITQSYQAFGYDESRFYIAQLFPKDTIINLTDRPSNLPLGSFAANTFKTRDELQSYFGRVNYSINDKYLFTGTLRVDGSTRFGGNNKYGVFPSAAFAWRLSDEAFIPELFDDLKLRLGYGITGNQEIGHNLYETRRRFADVVIGDGGAVFAPGINNVAFQNPDLKWETTSQLNLGLDFGFFNNRLYGSLDFYKKVTNDLLIQVYAAQPAPQEFTWLNLDAENLNQGVELNINLIAIDKDDFGLDIGVNLAYNHNEISDLVNILNTGEIRGQGLTGAYVQRIDNGQPLPAFYVRDFAGYDEEGIAQYEGGDVQKFVGMSPVPKYNYGSNINLRYKNWGLSAFMYGMSGHYVYNNTANAFFTKGSINSGRNVTEDVANSPESPANAPDVSTRFLEKADFLRLQNLNLSYNFPLEGKFVKSLKLSASAQNLFVLTDYSGLDPEVNTNAARSGVPSSGIDYTAYPRARTYTFGLAATF